MNVIKEIMFLKKFNETFEKLQTSNSFVIKIRIHWNIQCIKGVIDQLECDPL